MSRLLCVCSTKVPIISQRKLGNVCKRFPLGASAESHVESIKPWLRRRIVHCSTTLNHESSFCWNKSVNTRMDKNALKSISSGESKKSDPALPTLPAENENQVHLSELSSTSSNRDPNEVSNLQIYAFGPGLYVAKEICSYLGISLGRANVNQFADGEASIKVDDEVRGRDVYIVHTAPCLTSETGPDTRLLQFLLLVAALRRSSANKITAVLPYCSYFRQVPRANEHGMGSFAAADVAQMMRAMGVDSVILVDMHATQAESFFGDVIPVSNILPYGLAIEYFKQKKLLNPTVVGLGPTSGQRAKIFWIQLQQAGVKAGIATLATKKGGHFKESKNVLNPNSEVETPLIVGDVEGRDCIIVDDLINTAESLTVAADALKAHGAKRIFTYATHGLLSVDAVERINKSAVDEVVLTNSVPLPQNADCKKLRILSIGGLLGEAIWRIHHNIGIAGLYHGAPK